MMAEAGYKVSPSKKKIIKKPQYFIIKFPNGAEALIKIKGWAGCNDYINYIKDEYDEDTLLVSISKWEAFKFFLKGKLFPC
jgi:hypothetical protein